MATTNPLLLTHATRFQPGTFRTHSRSPSRSPLRKSQFAARELDPLLGNLSPDSTLKALQATSTIASESTGQDALARSIAEASPAEREIGIRAAVAAQKLKEWHQEVLKWPWPVRRDRGWGAGFLPPQRGPAPISTPNTAHLGYLPVASITEYQDKIEDIRDGVEALELEEVKDHVFSSHVPQRSVSAPQALGPSDTPATGYGRMRDFTALITATVIQALPELASLTMLLDTWDVRLSVLRQIPDITQSFRSTRAGIETAFSVVRSQDLGPLVTMDEYETTKNILGGKVASLGSKIDKLLDRLEGQEDSLPKSWIDTLEHVENQYAAWVVEAEHIVIRNQLLAKSLAEDSIVQAQDAEEVPHSSISNVDGPAATVEALPAVQTPITKSQPSGGSVKNVQSNNHLEETAPGTQLDEKKADLVKKPSLSISPPLPPPTSGHHRGVSEVSMADSAYSALSDISAAEIVDARSTQVLASPRISVVENPLRGSRDELSWLTGPTLSPAPAVRPAMLQRASTASIEVVSRNSVRQVTLTRSRSHDMLNQISPATPRSATPSQALKQLSGTNHTTTHTIDKDEHGTDISFEGDTLAVPEPASSTISPSPSLRVEPLHIRSRDPINEDVESPVLPRRSSKRLSQVLSDDNEEHVLPNADALNSDTPRVEAVTPVKTVTERSDETLEARIKDILDTMPNEIRLAKQFDNEETRTNRSRSSTPSSTPVPPLTLSPMKADRASRQASSGDVRVFHLTRSGQSRDAPPVKLFVRAVGEHGERVMVRVGGGWADLAEYLKEYSLHHGHRGLANGTLEVANFPTPPRTQRDPSASPYTPPSAGQPRTYTTTTQNTNSSRKSVPSTSLGFSDIPAITVNKVRKNSRAKTPELSELGPNNSWTPPPVPPIPPTYTVQLPTTVTTTTDGLTNTNSFEPPGSEPFDTNNAVSPPIHVSNSEEQNHDTVPNATGGTIAYTPLGAAGPKSSGRRAVTYSTISSVSRDSWVEGMVGKARAVSGSGTVVHGPTTTTTTTVISRSKPQNRRVSAFANLGTANNTPTTAGTASPASVESNNSPVPARPKSRMSLGDVSGIKRVFLRKKSDK